MTKNAVSEVLLQLRTMIAEQLAEGQTDQHLLERFFSQRDEAAFAALLGRHGPMVLGVCRRVLHDEHLAEDVFQATFMVLAHRAASIRKRESVGSWLHGVALRLARNAKAKAARSKRTNAQDKSQAALDPLAAASRHETQEILDDELQRLPEKYRLPLILCYLEGMTRDEAAVQLGWTVGKLRGLLERGRDQLRSQLVRRGVTLSAAGAATLLTDTVLSASVPPLLAVSTIHAAARFAAGTTLTACGISTPVAALTEAGITMMASKKMALILALALFVGLLGTGLAILGQRTEPIEKQPAGDLTVRGARTPLRANGPNDGAAKLDRPNQGQILTNSIGMKFVWLAPGQFVMGSPNEEKGRELFEGTDELQHKVILTRGFYMGVHLVTQEQWRAVMGKNPEKFKDEMNLPVDAVPWEDCQEFCKELQEMDKRPYRLPSEAEWEYACRAGTTTPFYCGETIATDQANYNGNYAYGNGSKGLSRKKTTPVGSFPANAWGLHDMHANVWEWCQDWYGNYPQNDVVDPVGPEAGKYRVVRGGSWWYHPDYCRSACRGRHQAGDPVNDDCGFRLCFFVE